ncbi:hypothetical protein ACOME3_005915 [Neoechinorhynchus agilis]
MNGREVEFLAENEIVTIIPNVTMEPIELLTIGLVGPFEAGIPIKLPLWAALAMKCTNRCQILPPDYIMPNSIYDLRSIENEKTDQLIQPTNEHFAQIGKLLIKKAPSNLIRPESVNCAIEDILDMRNFKISKRLKSEVKRFTEDCLPVLDIGFIGRGEVLQYREMICKQMEMLSRMENGYRNAKEEE